MHAGHSRRRCNQVRRKKRSALLEPAYKKSYFWGLTDYYLMYTISTIALRLTVVSERAFYLRH